MSIGEVKAILEDYKKQQLTNEEKIKLAHQNIEQLKIIGAQLVGAIYAADNILKMLEAPTPVVSTPVDEDKSVV